MLVRLTYSVKGAMGVTLQILKDLLIKTLLPPPVAPQYTCKHQLVPTTRNLRDGQHEN